VSYFESRTERDGLAIASSAALTLRLRCGQIWPEYGMQNGGFSFSKPFGPDFLPMVLPFTVSLNREACRFLAECHGAVGKVEPLWDTKEADLNHWKIMLTLRTIELKGAGISEQIHHDLETLRLKSDKARENRFVNLDFRPKNILVGPKGIGVIDFELRVGAEIN
jgi:hypothetical protein